MSGVVGLVTGCTVVTENGLVTAAAVPVLVVAAYSLPDLPGNSCTATAGEGDGSAAATAGEAEAVAGSEGGAVADMLWLGTRLWVPVAEEITPVGT